jgi:hypothetical protein
MRNRFAAIVFALLAVIGLTRLPAFADGLAMVATFPSATSKLSVANYTSGSTTVGLIGITVSSQTYSYSYDKNDLTALMALWNKAQQMDPSKYVAAGSVAETGTEALDVLLLAGGPGVRLSIADPINGLVTFELARTDYAAFDAALRKAADALSP